MYRRFRAHGAATENELPVTCHGRDTIKYVIITQTREGVSQHALVMRDILKSIPHFDTFCVKLTVFHILQGEHTPRGGAGRGQKVEKRCDKDLSMHDAVYRRTFTRQSVHWQGEAFANQITKKYGTTDGVVTVISSKLQLLVAARARHI